MKAIILIPTSSAVELNQSELEPKSRKKMGSDRNLREGELTSAADSRHHGGTRFMQDLKKDVHS